MILYPYAQMAPKSRFHRIVLVKSISRDCVKELRDHVGKYTHIQSFNGVLLDGLDISEVTKAFSQTSHFQFVVRYVHPTRTTIGIAESVASTTPTPMIMPSLDHKPPADRIDSFLETFPIPLIVLGDIPKSCKNLFSYLASTDYVSYTSADSDYYTISSKSASLAMREFTSSLDVSTERSKSASSLSSYDSYEESNLDEYSALSQSDRYVMRASVPLMPIHSTQPNLSPYNQDLPSFSVEKRYIINMFTNWEEDRRFSHLFLRESGLYLVVVSMEELMEDPAIQFENLLFWLRLVQTYVGPDALRRVIIVGMSNTSMSSVKEKKCLYYLEGAIQDTELQNIYIHNESSVFIFDQQNVEASLNSLFQCISKCMELFMNMAWNLYRSFFDKVFSPFTGLNEVLSCICRSQDIMMSSDSLLALYGFADPDYFHTLAAYSSALINVTDDRSKYRKLIYCKAVVQVLYLQ